MQCRRTKGERVTATDRQQQRDTQYHIEHNNKNNCLNHDDDRSLISINSDCKPLVKATSNPSLTDPSTLSHISHLVLQSSKRIQANWVTGNYNYPDIDLVDEQAKISSSLTQFNGKLERSTPQSTIHRKCRLPQTNTHKSNPSFPVNPISRKNHCCRKKPQ